MSTGKGSAIGSDIAKSLKVRRIATLVAAISIFAVAPSTQAQTAHVTSAVTLPATAVGTTSVSSTVSFVFDTGGTIAPPVVLTLGAPNLDFKDAGTGTCNTNGPTHSYASGQTCTVNVTFSPAYPGQHLGAVQLLTSGGTIIGTGPINGLGNGPFVTFVSSSAVLISQTPAKANNLNSSLIGVAVDGKGDVFVGDDVSGVLREIVAVNGKVSPTSNIVAVGSGIVSPGAIAIDGSGNIFVADTSDNSVKEIIAVNGAVSATSTVVTLTGGYSNLQGIAVDGSGDIFFTDYQRDAIYEVVAAGGVVTPSSVVSEIFSTSPYQPGNLQVDASGDIYLTEYNSINDALEVAEIFATDGIVSPGSTIQYPCQDYPGTAGFALDAAGDAFFASNGVGIAQCDPNENTLLTFPSYGAALGGIAYDGKGHLFTTSPSPDGYLYLGEDDNQTPPTLAFPITPAGSSSPYPLVLTLQNSGNSPLTFSVPASGNNPSATSPFVILPDTEAQATCPQLTGSSSAATLTPGGICTDVVDFIASGAARTVAGLLVTTDNDLNVAGSTQTDPLTGTVSDAISVAVTPGEIPYGTATYTLQATVTFAGPVPTGPLTFTVDSVPAGAGTCSSTSSTTAICTLPYNASTLSVGVHTVTATQAADYNYIQTSNKDTGNLTINPVPLATPQASVSAFPATPVGSTSTPVTITFTFNSSGSIGTPIVLTLGAPSLDYKDAGTGTCTTNGTAHVYVAGNTCTVNITFTPTALGQRPGSVLLPSTGSGGMPFADMAGLGMAPLVLFLTNLNPVTLTTTNDSLALSSSGGIAVDGKGDIIFADQGDSTVKMLVATNGSVSSSSAVVTLGSGFSDPSGVAVDARGNVFVSDNVAHQIKEIVAVDGVVSSTSQVVVLASGYTYLYGVAVDANENVFFADASSGTLYKLSPVNGAPPQTTVPTVIGSVYGAYGIQVDDIGDVFVGGGQYIQEFVAVNGVVTQSSIVNTFQNFIEVIAFAVDNAGNLFVSDQGDPALVQFYPGDPYGAQPTLLNDYTPGGLALDGKGHLFGLTAAPQGVSIQEIDLRTPPALTFPTTAPGATSAPQTVLFENEGNVNLTLPVPTSGSNPSTSPAAFVLDPNFRCPTADAPDGPATLYVGQACGDQVTFAPTGAAGIITGQLVTTDNDLNAAGPAYAQQVVSLTGISTNPVSVLVTSITIAFGTPSVTLTPTITYSGPAPTGAVTFTVDSIAAGTGTCTISSSTVRTCTVTYDSAVLSVGQHTIQATEAADYNYIQTSSSATNNFTVIPAPAATSQQTSNAFPTTAVGSTSAPVYLTFTFDHSESIAAPAVLTKGATGLDFKDAGTGTCTTNGTAYVYVPTSTCTVAVTFTPTLPGQRLGAVQLLSSSGTVLATTYIYGIGTGPLVTFPGDTVPAMVATGPSAPYGIAVDGKGDLFVAYTESGVVDEIVAVNGKVSASSTVIPIGSGFDAPYGIAVDGSGNVFVSDIFYNVVDEIVAVNGAVSASSTVVPLGSGFLYPEGLAVDAMGDVFVADNQNLQVKKISAINGTTSTVSVVGSGFRSPTGVAVDAMGDVFVADELPSQIKEIVASSGSVSASSPVNIVGSGFTYPIGVAVDFSGNVFVADTSGNAIQEIVAVNGAVSSTSTVNTLASGLDYPYAVAVDSSEHLFFPNPNSAIDEIDFQTPPTLVFPTTAPGSTSAAQAVILQNSGNAALSFPAAVMGTNPSISTGYVIGAGSTCPQLSTSSPAATLAAGTNCTDSIAFAPVAGQSGTVDGQLISTDTNLNASSSMQTVPLTGTVTPTVSVTALSPNQGPIAGGTSVVITGTEFTGATAVLFGSTPATSFTVNSATQITAITPPSAAGLVSVTVTTPIGTSPNSVQFLYVYPLKTFTVSGFPAPAILTEFGTVTVTAINSNNVADTTFIGTVTLSSTDPIATLPAPYTFQPSDNGTHTFTVYLNTKGTQSITATSGTVSGSQTGIVVSDAIWVLNANGQLTKLNVAGVPLLSGIVEPGNPASYGGVAFDHSQYAVPTGGLGIDPVYAVNNALNSLVMTDTQDGMEPGPAGYVQAEGNFSGGGVSGPSAIASDGAGFLWIANQFGNSISEFATTGIFVSPPSGFGSSYVVGDTFNQPSSIAIDQTGGVWVANKAGNSVTHVFGTAAPVPTPLSAATAAGTLGEKP